MIHLLCLLLWPAGAAPASAKIDDAIRRTEVAIGRRVYVGPVPPQMRGAVPESMAGLGARAAYLVMRKNAPDAELAHELIHVELLAEHFMALTPDAKVPLANVLSANLQDFVSHPRLDRMARAWGFQQDEIAGEHAGAIREYILTACDAETERKMGKIQLAGNALGLAEVLQRGNGPLDAVRVAAAVHAPTALSLATELMRRFPAAPEISAKESFARARAILAFLDGQVKERWGPDPSSVLRLVDATETPNIPPVLEELIRDYWRGVETSEPRDARCKLP